MTVPCAHCGLPANADPTGAPSFCCAGCRTVWALVHEAGLSDYYRLRARLGDDPQDHPGAAQAPTAAEAPAYAHLDDPQILAAIAVAASAPQAAAAVLEVVGLHCAACVWLIERLPAVLPGVLSARLDYGAARLHLEWDPQQLRLSQIAGFLHRAGYSLHALDATAEDARRDERRRALIRIAVAGASAGNVMLVSFALHAGALSGIDLEWSRFFSLTAMILALPAVTWGALPFYRSAWAGLRLGRLHIDLPIALGVAGGFVASAITAIAAALGGSAGPVYFDSVSLLVFLLLIGRFIQQRGQSWALSQTDLLQLLVPARARRRANDDPDGALQDCAAASLEPGARVVVCPGERVPVDGRVVAGRGSIDASSLTGESLPQSVEVGSTVSAGTRSVEGTLEIAVEAVGAQTRVGSLAARIMEADRSRAPIQRAVDRLSAGFVAAVLAAAGIGGLIWWQIDPSRVFPVVVSLLVISCPCALGLATPVALAVARGRAARRGILFASAGALESLAKVERVVFDKTGTLTEGVLEVRQAIVDPPFAATLPAILAAVEADSGHPIAQALRRWADEQAREGEAREGSSAIQLRHLDDRVGRGREAGVAIHGHPARVRVGSLAWIDRRGRFDDALEAALGRGETPVLVEIDDRPVALLTLVDTPRPDAALALAGLRDMGLDLAIRSGDHPLAVAALARSLEIDDAAGAMSPRDKARDLAGDRPCAMVGDGVNDAPAMRAATVGVAVRGGAEVALRVADVHLARAGLLEVVALFTGARRTMAIIRRNLGFSLIYNLLFAGLALAGRIDPLAAAILMPASSLTVLLSSVLGRTFHLPATERPSAPFAVPAPADRGGPAPLQSLHANTTVQPANSL